jgi:hypothetical protein
LISPCSNQYRGLIHFLVRLFLISRAVGRESESHPAFCISGRDSGETEKLATPKIRTWVCFPAKLCLSRLNLGQFIAAFETEISVVRHPDLADAADLEEFPTLT